MLNKCLLLAVFSTAFTLSMQGAAMVTCSQPGYSETVFNGICAASSSGDALEFGAFTQFSVSGNTFTAMAYASIFNLPIKNSGPYPMTATAVWNDVFEVPVSSPADVLKITVFGGGLNHPASVDVGPILYDASDFCDGHYTGNPVCTKKATVAGDNFLSVQLTGTDTVSVDSPCGYSNCGFSVNSDLSEYVSIQQFLADGVTPVSFTTAPEPQSIALLLLGLPAGLGFFRRR
jgi:hypothetical protein